MALDDAKLRKQILFFRDIPGANGMAGHLFETFVHRVLAKTTTMKRSWLLNAMSYEDTDQPTVKITSDEVPLDVRFAQVMRIIH